MNCCGRIPRRSHFFRAMLHRYPKRLNPGALWSGAKAL